MIFMFLGGWLQGANKLFFLHVGLWLKHVGQGFSTGFL